jgi:ribosome production factor 2
MCQQLLPHFNVQLYSKPKNARVKRALEAREAKVIENEKTAIFVRGQSTSERVRDAMKDLVSAATDVEEEG